MDWAGMPPLDIDLAQATRLPDGRALEWESLGDGDEPLA